MAIKKQKSIDKETIFSEFESIEAIGKGEEINPEQRGETLQERFNRERQEWERRIKDMASRIKEVDELTDLQVDVYSARQELVEYYHYLMSLIFVKNMEIRKKKKERLEYYITGYDFKLDKEQKEMYIKIDLEDLYIIRDELENHLKYINSTIMTIDNIIYGIKHRLTIEEYKRRL